MKGFKARVKVHAMTNSVDGKRSTDNDNTCAEIFAQFHPKEGY